MKTIKLASGLILAAAAMFFASCDDDRGDNPTLNTESMPSSFVLNVPAYATNNTYDLSKSDYVKMTCNQPNYIEGVPLGITYAVEVSLTQDFAKFSKLKTPYYSTKLNVIGKEMNNAIVKLYQAANNNEDPTGKVISAYVRIHATIGQVNGSDVYSNVVTFPKVFASYLAEIPEKMYVSNIQENGSTFREMPSAYGVEGKFFAMIYAPAGATFRWSKDGSEKLGYTDATAVIDNASAGVKAASDGSIQIANAGWYTVYMNCSVDIKKNKLITNLNINPAETYIIGNAAGGWNERDSKLALTAPTNATGEWISPAFSDDGELRAYVHVDGLEWWRTEFTLFKKESLVWRDVDIPSSWAETKGKGADYSVSCKKGQKLYVDFNKNTGYVK
jgi:hypothetical protein